ncbi:MAG: hypothetical protein KF890_02320 [Nitrospira sp.]|nr:hypothetical protein [Nitrospira sp.]
MLRFINIINWNSWPAKAVAVILIGTVLGLFWVFSDLATDYGVLGWIIFAIVVIPLYAIGEELGSRVLSEETGRRISDRSFSWKRILVALLLFIGMFGTAAAIYFAIRS